MRILIVEDNVKLAGHLRRGLMENGFVVDLVGDGVEGRHRAVNGEYALVLLDARLPGVDGFAVLEALRRTRTTPVLMLSAADDVDDRVRGLRAGADDYLAKPFAFQELLARIHALLRRSGTDHPLGSEHPSLGDLRLDLVRRRAYRGSVRLELTAREYTLLSVLLKRRGEVLSRAILTEQVWDASFDGDSNVVEVAVRRLRAKLDDPFEVKLLHTVRGVGYVLESHRHTESLG